MRHLFSLPLLLVLVTGCRPPLGEELALEEADQVESVLNQERSLEQRCGTRFVAFSPRFHQAPTLTPIALPVIAQANAIWGASGRDDLGNVYLGIYCDGGDRPSATLCRVDPESLEAIVLGDASINLERDPMNDPNSQQAKIHGKPVQADDGFVYVASMDEEGENEDGSVLPVWGSHLWRIDPFGDGAYWEHLLATPEALIATACTGRYVYALGYFGHQLYQFDTETHATRRKSVGSVGGHITRNFLVDLNEHAYVPRVVRSKDGKSMEVELIELDTQLNEVAAHPLEDYGATTRADSHGIVSFVTMKNGDLVFVTAKGALYRLHPNASSASTLDRLGWIHPDGESYSAFLVCPDGESVLGAIARPAKSQYQWVTYDLRSSEATVLELDPESDALLQRPGTLIYGSNTIDDQGNAIAVGRFSADEGGHRPFALRVSWP
jgi:hypothetical protein